MRSPKLNVCQISSINTSSKRCKKRFVYCVGVQINEYAILFDVCLKQVYIPMSTTAAIIVIGRIVVESFANFICMLHCSWAKCSVFFLFLSQFLMFQRLLGLFWWDRIVNRTANIIQWQCSFLCTTVCVPRSFHFN